jgi:hypothetical protein
MLSTITTCANLPVFVTGVSGCVISLSTASWQSENAEGTSRVFTRTKRNFSAETLANRAAKKDQYVLKEERLSTYSFIARDIFVDDVDEEEVESDEVVDGQFYKFQFNFLRQ